MEIENKQMQAAIEKVFVHPKNRQYMEQAARKCCGGFLRKLVQEATEWLEQGRGVISSAYIHYHYGLQVTSNKAKGQHFGQSLTLISTFFRHEHFV